MDASNPEPTLEELLTDPIIQLVMRRDNVVAGEVRQIMDEARERRGESGECSTNTRRTAQYSPSPPWRSRQPTREASIDPPEYRLSYEVL